MATPRRSQLLLLLLVTATIACGFAWSFLNTNRDRATASQMNRAAAISELHALDLSVTSHKGGSDDPAINRRLRAAANAANATEQLASIEPGVAIRSKDSSYTQTPIYVRLNAVSLKQLISFLCAIDANDDKLLTKDIELSPPLVAPSSRSDAAETWTADITFGYLGSN